jgi:threonine aldolase
MTPITLSNPQFTGVSRVVDFRSDAVTEPTTEMWQAMREASLGWAPMGEDPSVIELERYAAELVGKEAALFLPTGTMANLLALMTHTDRGDHVVLDEESHILWSEEWSLGYICGLIPNRVRTNAGAVSLEMLDKKLSERRFNHRPRTSLICLENTHNLSGGSVMSGSQIDAVGAVAGEHKVAIHLDGARIFNACIAANEDIQSMAASVDTLMFCLGKGLSAPAGALLCGTCTFIQRSITHLKRLGGFSIPQIGIFAAAGMVALRTMIPRLTEDHRRAKSLATGIAGLSADLTVPHRVETNIVMVSTHKLNRSAQLFVKQLAEHGVHASLCTDDLVRFVTHRHIDDQSIADAIRAIDTVVSTIA